MPADRFYLCEPFEKGNAVFLSGDENAHLKKVMRKKKGDLVELVNGKHQLASAQIHSFEKQGTHLTLLEVKTKEPALAPLILAQALTKPSQLEWIIQKGTELGMSECFIFPSKNSEKKELSKNQKKRLHLITIGAMKQCGRLDLPKLHFFNALEALALPKKDAVFGDPTSSLYLSEIASPNILFIGPEKGWAEEEEKSLKQLFHATGVRLHPYVLRTETAALTALSLAATNMCDSGDIQNRS